MSTIIEKTIKTMRQNDYKITVERYDSVLEMTHDCETRRVTNSLFQDMKTHNIMREWHGVESYEEALGMLKNGYAPAVKELKAGTKINAKGMAKRIAFKNEIQGFAPIVPLAMMGVPNSMINTIIRPIKKKVIDVYYDMTASSGTEPEEIIERGKALLGAIVELEAQGYRFNLYAMQSYSDGRDADVVVVKVKSSDKPLDLQRISFPLMHTAFFRVIGFDWYSKTPKARYRNNYGRALAYTFGKDDLKTFSKAFFGDNAIYMQGVSIGKDSDYLKEVLTCKE